MIPRYGSLQPFADSEGNLGVCPKDALLAIDLKRESELITICYFYSGVVFEGISDEGKIEIIEKWLEADDQMDLSALAYLVNNLLHPRAFKKKRSAYFEVLKRKISDPSPLKNLKEALNQKEQLDSVH